VKRVHALFLLVLLSLHTIVIAQPSNPAPYCTGGYSSGTCNQTGASNNPSNFINDFINDFNTTGANNNIVNNNSGCNTTGGPTNYYNYSCQHYMQVTPGQTITCNIRSGIIFQQGFVIYIDWNQDNVFQNPGEQVAGTSNVPAANTWTVLSFVIPSNQANGAYRMRVKCAYATNGTAIAPCGNYGFGECEDYTIFIGPIPSNVGIVTATASANSPMCSGTTLSLNVVTNATGLTYTWTGPGSYSSTSQNPVIALTTASMSGTYSVIANNGTCPATRTVAVQIVNYPNFMATPASPTICQGGSITAQAQFPTPINTSSYNFQWAPTPTAGIFSPLTQVTPITPSLLPATQSIATVIYSITVTPTALNCPTMKTLTLTINNPFTPTMNMPPMICHNAPQIQLTASPSGGVWSNNVAVGSSGILNPAMTTSTFNTVKYTVFIGNCQVSNTDTFQVVRFHSAALTGSYNLVCVQDPVMNLMNIVQDTVSGTWSPSFLVSQGRYFNPAGLSSGIYTLKYKTNSTPVGGICRDSSQINLQVFNPPVPVISNILPKCTNEPTVALSASPTGGVWSGNPGVTPNGVQTPSLNAPGTNFVTYTAGQGTCNASSTASFQVAQFRPATITQPMPDLCFNAPQANLLSIVAVPTGTWTGINVNSSTNMFSPAGLPTGTYLLTYSNSSTPIASLCPDWKTTTVYVLNPPTPAIGQAGPLCNADPTLQLSVSPATGSWVPLNYLNANGVFNPAVAAIGLNAVQYIIGTATCNAKDTKYISVENFVSAALTSQLPELCDNSLPINLSFITLNNNGVWSGMGVQGTNFNPALTGAGVFQLNHNTASSPSGLCPDQATIAVRVFSLAPPHISDAGPYCNTGVPVQLTVSPVGGLFQGDNTQAVSSSGMFMPGNASIGDNLVSYSIASGPCVAHAQKTVTVVKFVSAGLAGAPDDAYCRNKPSFNLNSLAKNPGGIWSGDGVSGDMFEPARAKLGANKIHYKTFSTPIDSLCPDENSFLINVEELQQANITAATYTACAPAEIPFYVPQLGGARAQWYFGDDTEPSEGLTTSHTYMKAGTYSVTMNYWKGACSGQATLSIPIKIKPSPVAEFRFSKEEVTIADPEVDGINMTSDIGANRYHWSVPGLGESDEVNPRFKFERVGDYEVKLVATSYEGCSDEFSKVISVKNEFGIFVPNSFTPNYDGLNDVFKPVFTPYGLDTRTFEMRVYDRWGILVFSSSDPNKGWDGSHFNKGDEPMKEDAYTWIIRYRDLDGKQYDQKGFVTLIKR
jgi:gliding motility-associated-like protein